MTKLENLNPDFRDLLLALSTESAEFMIVGAYALALHDVASGRPKDLVDARRLRPKP